MGAEKIGSMSGQTTVKVLPANETSPRFETTGAGTGTLAGVDVQFMATYGAELRPNGFLYGECPNSGVIMAGDGVATFRASGTGSFTEDGGATFKGIVYFETSAPSLSSLNGAAVVYNWDVDGEGGASWELWQWK
ncbi:MAG: hypothetical protein CL781_02345 [Chloroflexi bacterium]|nr:hypothetical protein [Chloroflexota bacterium]|tara:strand:+ start:517 stop:921 length:405 start_codon:yes stop_codon:yes gene_type:complete